ncbi:MAG TPA: ABC transporter permease [Bryobacteraceae bacterium]
MSNTVAIWQKELKGYFATPMGAVLLVTSAIFFLPAVYTAGNELLRLRLLVAASVLTRFHPSRELASHPVLSVVSFARLLAMYIIPLITMRLFAEEKQARTIELLLTSPISETDIVLGKWFAGLFLYLLIIGLGALEFAISPLVKRDWATVLIAYAALVSIGAGLLAVGECISTFTSHQLSAAVATLLVSVGVWRYFNSGVPHVADLALCVLLMLLGWWITLRSIRARMPGTS